MDRFFAHLLVYLGQGLTFFFIETPIGYILLLAYILHRMKVGKMDVIKSHWHHTFDDFTCSSDEHYAKVKAQLIEHGIPGLKIRKVNFYEGIYGLSRKRIYLRVQRHQFVFDICASPFAKRSYFFSWWFGYKYAWYRKLLRVLPFIGERLDRFFFPETYFKEDTAQMFQGLVKQTVDKCLDATTSRNKRIALSYFQKKPHFEDILKRA